MTKLHDDEKPFYEGLPEIISELPIKDPRFLIKLGLAIAPKEMGRKGGLKGGPERARRLSSERRKEIAQKAARARWEKKEPAKRNFEKFERPEKESERALKPIKKTGYQENYDRIMDEVNDLPVSEALKTGKVVRCPICGIIHPGIRYSTPDHRQYDSTACFREGMKREKGRE